MKIVSLPESLKEKVVIKDGVEVILVADLLVALRDGTIVSGFPVGGPPDPGKSK